MRRVVTTWALTTAFFAVWTACLFVSPATLNVAVEENGVVETSTAGLFLASSILFAMAARNQPGAFVTWAWAALMFVFCGEEISWGQHWLGFGTPEVLAAHNRQREFNIHNLEVLEYTAGGKDWWLTLMMGTTGVGFWLAAQVELTRRIMRRFCVPYSPLRYALLFVGGVAFGALGQRHAFSVNDPLEIRELALSIGMCLFAYGTLRRPSETYVTRP